MIVNVNGKEINFDEVVDILDVIDCHDKDVEIHGFDTETGVYEYSATASESCGEIVEIDEDSIEPLDDLYYEGLK
mgnify:CR=1 FL=1